MMYMQMPPGEGLQDSPGVEIPPILIANTELPGDPEARETTYGLQHTQLRRLGRRALLISLAGALLVAVATFGTYSRLLEPPHLDGVSPEVGPLRGLEGPTSASAFLRWARHPEKCLSVPVSGDKVELWDCEDIPDMKFVVPPNRSTGPIVWASNPRQCLYASGGTRLQLWSCEDAPEPENTQWLISPGGGGRIHLASDPEKCLDVPGGSTANGNLVQVGKCGEPEEDGSIADIAFAGYASHPDPAECAAGEWTDWSDCSATCGWGKRGRTRKVLNTEEQACLSTPESELDTCILYECIRVLDDQENETGHEKSAAAGRPAGPAVLLGLGLLRLAACQPLR